MGFDFQWISDSIDALTTNYASLFLAEGRSWLHWIAITVLIIYALKWALSSASHWHGTFDLPGLVHFFYLFLIAEAMLTYWDKPLPFGDATTLGLLIPHTANQLAAFINQSETQVMMNKMQTVIDNLQTPSVVPDVGAWLAYLISMSGFYIAEALMFVLNIVGYIAVGLGILIAPLFIPFLVWPRMSILTSSVLFYLIEYSLWRVLANALAFIWANAWSLFIDNAVHSDYSLAHFTVLSGAIVIMGFGMVWSVFQVGHFASGLIRGAANAGQGFGTTAAIAIRGLL